MAKEEPWKDVCCKACYFAIGKRCKCKCGGKYHGKGLSQKVKESHERLKQTTSLDHFDEENRNW